MQSSRHEHKGTGYKSSNPSRADLVSNEIQRLASSLGVPDAVRDTALNISRQAANTGPARGKKLQSLVGVSLYIACRQAEIPVTFRELATLCGVKKWRDISKSYSLLIKNMAIIVPVVDTRKYVRKIASKAGKSEQAVNLSIQIIDKANQQKIKQEAPGMAGRGPMSVAAAALYVACLLLGEKVTQKEMAVAAQVTELSIRNGFRAFREALQLSTPSGKGRRIFGSE